MLRSAASLMRRHVLAVPLVIAVLLPASLYIACDAADLSRAPGTAQQSIGGVWQEHRVDFHFMGFTSTYTCSGLSDKLGYLLNQLEARDVRITPICGLARYTPDRFAQARVQFSSLIPSDAAGPDSGSGAAGSWGHIRWAPHHPYALDDGDCELIQEFREKILPMFATRNLHAQLNCVPHQDTGAYALGFDVFVPASTGKSGLPGNAHRAPG
jgi:hypothetical protein